MSSRSSMCRVSLRHRGVASLELVLCLPILIVITYLAVAITLVGHRRLDAQVNARTSAHYSATGLTRILSTSDSLRAWNERSRLFSHPAATSQAGSRFLDTFSGRHRRFEALHTATTTVIVPSVVASRSDFLGPPVLGNWRVPVLEQHGVIATPIWERASTPLGHDRYLRSRLKALTYGDGFFYSGSASDGLPNIFPRAR